MEMDQSNKRKRENQTAGCVTVQNDIKVVGLMEEETVN